MKYLDNELPVNDAECQADAVSSSALLLQRLRDLESELAEISAEEYPSARASALLDCARVLLDLSRLEEAWAKAKEAFDLTLAAEDWPQAVQACDLMSQTEHADAVRALSHGVWLGVTYPVDPEISVSILHRLVEETPAKADAAAVAAAAARYVVDLRAVGKQRSDLQFFVAQMLADVARKHSGVDTQELYDFWTDRLQLDDAASVLSRLGRILDVLAPDPWWYDRDMLRTKLPVD